MKKDESIGCRKFCPLRKSNKKIDRYMVGTTVFLWCLAFLFVIFAADFIWSAYRGGQSGLINQILEIVKTLLFTICGYLFGRTEINSKKDNDCDNNQ